ncbi:hypothetical protein DPEC_G00326840 [Dallia pectoralis]|uniref:Uncharacterized protein n=1 Tax=Dallia pectoralis TaxID=75939 RepID=A0ACC2F7V9_DALPE|nr:hypothetical protein DPEC_G00326840 [Dallia pectoralis]
MVAPGSGQKNPHEEMFTPALDAIMQPWQTEVAVGLQRCHPNEDKCLALERFVEIGGIAVTTPTTNTETIAGGTGRPDTRGHPRHTRHPSGSD